MSCLSGSSSEMYECSGLSPGPRSNDDAEIPGPESSMQCVVHLCHPSRHATPGEMGLEVRRILAERMSPYSGAKASCEIT